MKLKNYFGMSLPFVIFARCERLWWFKYGEVVIQFDDWSDIDVVNFQ